MGPFNNREIATALWLLVFAAWALRKAEIRKSLAGVGRAFCRFKILVPVCLMALYTAVAVTLLAVVEFWNISLLKDTIVWFWVSAMAMMMRFATCEDAENIFQKVVVDSVKIVVVLEFLVNTYTFSLPAELLILPVVTLMGMFEAVGSLDKQYSQVAKLAKGGETIIGLAIGAIVLRRAISDLQNLQSLETVRSIALAPALSLLFAPLLYVIVLASKYELVFLRLELGSEKERNLKRYARRRILMYTRLSLRRVQDLVRNCAVDLMHIQTKADVDRLLESCKDSGSPYRSVSNEGGGQRESPTRTFGDKGKDGGVG